MMLILIYPSLSQAVGSHRAEKQRKRRAATHASVSVDEADEIKSKKAKKECDRKASLSKEQLAAVRNKRASQQLSRKKQMSPKKVKKINTANNVSQKQKITAKKIALQVNISS